jgi:hypothetical protein
MERRDAELAAEIDDLNEKINEANKRAYEAWQERILAAPGESVTQGGMTSNVSKTQAKVAELEEMRGRRVKERMMREPLLVAERQRDAETKAAGLIRRAKADLGAAREKIEADVRVLVDDWNGLYVAAIEKADRLDAFNPAQPEYRDLLRFVTDHLEDATRPAARRLHDVLLGRQEQPSWATFGVSAAPLDYSYRARQDAQEQPEADAERGRFLTQPTRWAEPEDSPL